MYPCRGSAQRRDRRGLTAAGLAFVTTRLDPQTKHDSVVPGAC